MRIVQVSPFFYPHTGGVESHVRTLAREFARQGHDVTVLEASGRATGTDADAIHLSRAGVPTGTVAVPMRYMHSPVELGSVADMQAAARLIAAFANLLEPGMSFER